MEYDRLVREWKEKGIYPYFPVVESPSDRLVRIRGESQAYMLASCDYLGLSNDNRLKMAAISGVMEYGTNICGSLAFSGMTVIHNELERAIQNFMHVEDAIIFPTSYLANLGCLSTICGVNDLLIFDSQNHVSLYHGAALSRATLRTYKHGDMDMLDGILRRAKNFKKLFIVTDGLFSADGDYANTTKICELASKYGARVIIDSAHDIAAFGDQGRGVLDTVADTSCIDLIVGTMSKGFGSTGGFVAGREQLITQMRHAAGPFHSSRAVSPGVAAASREAINIVRIEGAERRDRLNKNAARMLNGLNEMGLDTMGSCSPVIPILIRDSTKTLIAASKLRKRGIIVCAMLPPSTPEGAARLRLNVTCLFHDEDIEDMLAVFKDTLVSLA